MNRTLCTSLVLLLSTMAMPSLATPISAYAGQQDRAIKALSPEDVQLYLTGKGQGMARAGELNGYAGPAHVLELGTQLGLTPEQRVQSEVLFASMERHAIPLGTALVEAERRLDALFASKAITPALLSESLNEIGALQAKVRAVHLNAHLEQVTILTPEQSARYAQLRGYTAEAPTHGTAHSPTDQHVH